MERIARETGGADFDGRGRGLADSFRQIGKQLRSGNEVAYHTTNPPCDHTFHKIVIKPKRPELTVLAKTGMEAKIDLVELEKLAAMQATDEEIGAFFGVSARTILRRRKHVPEFAEVMQRGRAKGRLS